MVRSYCGHGIGDLFHCAPNIPHYSNNKVTCWAACRQRAKALSPDLQHSCISVACPSQVH